MESKELTGKDAHKSEKHDSAMERRPDEHSAIYNEALRKAISLRVETELEAVRLYNGGVPAESPASGVSLRDFLRVFFRNKAIILTTFFGVMFAVILGLKLRTPIYEAKVKMLISGEKQVQSPFYRDVEGSRQPLAVTQSEIVNSYPIIETAAKALRLYEQPLGAEPQSGSFLKRSLDNFNRSLQERKLAGLSPEERQAAEKRMTEDRLRKSIKVEPVRDTNLFTISVKDPNPQFAATAANVVSRAYLMFDIEQQLAELQLKYGDKNQAIIELKDNIAQIANNLNGTLLSNVEAIGPASVKIIEQARVPMEPVGLPDSLILLAALAMAALLATVVAFFADVTDPAVKSSQEVESLLSVPMLGAVYKRGFGDKPLLLEAKRSTLFTQSYQSLSDNLYMVMKNKNKKSLLLCPVSDHEEMSSILSNVGIYLSCRANLKVLLIDADLREPSLYKHFNIGDDRGLVDILEGTQPFGKVVRNPAINLSVLPAGRSMSNPYTILGSPAMEELIQSAQKLYDIVLINCPNLNDYRDAYALCGLVDGVVLTATENRTRRHVIKNAFQSLERMNAPILGVVLNNRVYTIPKFIYERV